MNTKRSAGVVLGVAASLIAVTLLAGCKGDKSSMEKKAQDTYKSASSKVTGTAEKTANGVKADWTQLKGDVKKKWGKLTDDELMQIDGSYTKLVGKIKEKYNQTEEDIRAELDEMLN